MRLWTSNLGNLTLTFHALTLICDKQWQTRTVTQTVTQFAICLSRFFVCKYYTVNIHSTNTFNAVSSFIDKGFFHLCLAGRTQTCVTSILNNLAHWVQCSLGSVCARCALYFQGKFWPEWRTAVVLLWPNTEIAVP